MSKTLASMRRGTLKATARLGTSFPLPTSMAVLMHCSYRLMRRATLMLMMLCVAPVSMRMWTPVLDTTPIRYIEE